MCKIIYKKYSVDKKSISTLFLVLLGLLTFLFINLITVKADTIIAPVQYVTSDTTLYITNNKGAEIQLNSTVQNSNNIDIKKIVMNINYNFKGNVIYQIELSTPTQYLINVNNVSILSNDNTCSFKGITDANVGFPKIRFTCPYDTNYVTIGLSNLSDNNITSSYNFRWNYTYLSIVNENVVDLNPVLDGQGQIKDEITDSTNTITGSINDTENNINQNINDMQQSIVDSNKETQDVIKDQFNSCRDSYNLLNFNDNNRESNGIIINVSNNIFNISGTPSASYSNITPNTSFSIPKGTYTFSISNTLPFNVVLRLTLNDNSRSDYTINSGSRSVTFTTSTSSTIYLFFVSGLSSSNTYNESFKIQLQKGSVATDWEPSGEQICSNKLDEQNETSKGIWATIKNLPNMFLDMLLGLFIPKDLSFIDEFKEVISNKLGFIASVPIQIIDFILGLANVAFEEITTISFPSIEIFGVHFWNAEDIDITILLNVLKPFKYFTDLTCVILCCRTLYDMYHNFTGGGAD